MGGGVKGKYREGMEGEGEGKQHSGCKINELIKNNKNKYIIAFKYLWFQKLSVQ